MSLEREPDPRRTPQNAQKPYHLVESEFSFLRSGEPAGSYQNRPDKLYSRVEEKVQQLPDRLALLFEDVSLLDKPPYSEQEPTFDVADGEEWGYFTPEQWHGAWWALMVEMGAFPEEDLSDAFGYRSIHSHNPAGEFGRQLGQLWASLMLYPQDIPPERLWIDAIQGFIDGLYLDNPDLGGRDRPQERREFVETLVDEIDTRAMEKIDSEAEEEEDWFDDWKAGNQSIQQTQEKVDEILEDEGIDPVYIGNYVHFEFTDRLREHSPTGLEEEITAPAVRELIEEEQLRAKSAILAKLYDDATDIRKRSGKGPEPTAILKTIYRDEGASSLEIAKKRTRREHQSGVTETAADLAGQKNPDDRQPRVWDEFPILEGDPDEWTLTTYGRLLARHMFEDHLGLGVRDLTDEHVNLLAPTVDD